MNNYFVLVRSGGCILTESLEEYLDDLADGYVSLSDPIEIIREEKDYGSTQ